MPFMTEELWAHTAGEASSATPGLPCRMAGAVLRRRRRGGRDQLADRSGFRHSFGSRRNERPAVCGRAAGRCRRQRPDARTPGRHDAAIRRLARVDGISLAGRGAEGRRRSSSARRRSACRSAALIDLAAEKARLGEGDRQGRWRDGPYQRQAVEREVRRQCQVRKLWPPSVSVWRSCRDRWLACGLHCRA